MVPEIVSKINIKKDNDETEEDKPEDKDENIKTFTEYRILTVK